MKYAFNLFSETYLQSLVGYETAAANVSYKSAASIT
jgi:hypothetical protein